MVSVSTMNLSCISKENVSAAGAFLKGAIPNAIGSIALSALLGSGSHLSKSAGLGTAALAAYFGGINMAVAHRFEEWPYRATFIQNLVCGAVLSGVCQAAVAVSDWSLGLGSPVPATVATMLSTAHTTASIALELASLGIFALGVAFVARSYARSPTENTQQTQIAEMLMKEIADKIGDGAGVRLFPGFRLCYVQNGKKQQLSALELTLTQSREFESLDKILLDLGYCERVTPYDLKAVRTFSKNTKDVPLVTVHVAKEASQ